MMSSLFDPLSFSSYTPMWLMMLLNLLVKGTVVLLAAALFGLLLQRASASSRYLVWSSALLALVALPILPLLLPVWQIPLPGDLFPVAVSQPAAAVSPAPLPTASVNESNTQPPGRLSPQTEAMPAHNSRVKTGDSMVLQEPARRSKPALLSTPTMHWSTWAVMAWLAGVVAVLGRLAVGFVRAGWLVRRAKPVTDETWKALLLDLADPMGLADRVKLLQSDRAVMPMAWGLFRPVVLLPDDKDQWSDELRRMVLLHELAHVKRRDCLVQMLASTVCSLHWINPMVWIAARRLRIERERACDDHVLSRGVRASDYAEGLLEMARSLRSVSFSSLATVTMAAQGSQLESRLLAILNPRLPRGALTRGAMALSVAGVACIALPLAAMQPAAEKSERPVVGVAEVQPASPSRPSDLADFQPIQELPVALPPDPQPVRVKDQGQEGSLTELALLSSNLEPQPQPVVPKKSRRGRRDDRDRLDQIKNSRDLETLSEALKDEDVKVRRTAIRALGKIENESAVDLLIGALTDSSAEIRRRAARALGKIEDAGAVEALDRALNDEDLEVRQAAIRALGDIEDVSAVGWLIPALTDPNVEIRRGAARALGEIEEASAVEALAGALNDEDLEVRQAAIRALGEIEDVSAVGWLIPALTDSSVEIRRGAARALGEIEDAGALLALGGALNDEDLEVRQMAIRALGRIRDVSAVDGLIPALTDSSSEIRRRAAWALGEIADARAVPALNLAAEDADAKVRRAATRALLEIERR